MTAMTAIASTTLGSGFTGVALGAAAGAVAGVSLWRWLRTGSYRIAQDEPRLEPHGSWRVVPGAAAAGALAGTLREPWALLAVWIYLVGSVAIVWIDLDVHRVPDRVLRWWAPAVAAAAMAVAGTGEGWNQLVSIAAAAAAMSTLFLGLALVGSMGLGDVKLAGVTGTMLGVLGWTSVITGVASCFVAGALAGVVMMARGASRRSHLAFGPAIVAGAAAAVVRAGFGV